VKARRVLTWAGGVTLALVVGAGLAAPRSVRWKIESDHPDVKVKGVKLSRQGVTLTGVTIERSNLRAELHSVFSRDGASVLVSGGTLEITLGERAKEVSDEKGRDIHGQIDTVKVLKGDAVITATNVTFDKLKVCAERAHAMKPGYPEVDVEGACALRDGSALDLKSATAPLTGLSPQFEKLLEHVSGLDKNVRFTDVHVRPRERTFRAASIDAGSARCTGINLDVGGDAADIKVQTLTFEVPRLHPTGLSLKDFHLTAARPWADAKVEIQGAHLDVRPGDTAIEGDQPCDAWVSALPEALREGPLTGKWEGQLAFKIQVKPEPKLTLKGTCRTSCTAFAPLRKVFTYRAYNAKGREFERKTGPRTPEWVTLSSMSPALPLALVALEDPGFYKHHGFIAQALENSLKDDVKLSKFARGGSTITMQLAKNLFLRRDKTLARKTQEILLAMGIEGCFSKDEILEIYLNVVEFGPDTYGIRDAADKRFEQEPLTLTPDEALYLASILPNPKKAASFEKAKDRVQVLAKRLMESGRLPEDAFTTAADQTWEAE